MRGERVRWGDALGRERVGRVDICKEGCYDLEGGGDRGGHLLCLWSGMLRERPL